MRRGIPALIFFLLLVSSELFGQFAIQGAVINGETNAPLQGANVFLSGTSYGVSSDEDGSFAIVGLPDTHFKMVVSFVGYETQMVDVDPDNPVFYKIVLKPSLNQLKAVIVKSGRRSRAKWLSNLAMFRLNFIGPSDNARLCTIENPDVLTFEERNGLLKAYADSVLVIENMALGFRVKFLIAKYEHNAIRRKLYYQGDAVYEPIVPKDQEQEMTWAQARLKAYYGSEMHFLRALYSKRLIEEGFLFNLLHEEYVARRKILVGIADTTITIRTAAFKRMTLRTLTNYNRIADSLEMTRGQIVLNFKDQLEVTYTHEVEGYRYQLSQFSKHDAGFKTLQRSKLVMLRPEGLVESTGQVYPRDALEMHGYWAWELVAESLPLDYDPAVDNAILEKNKQQQSLPR